MARKVLAAGPSSAAVPRRDRGMLFSDRIERMRRDGSSTVPDVRRAASAHSPQRSLACGGSVCVFRAFSSTARAQEREFKRLGGTRSLQANVRVIAATNRNLRRAVEGGIFREDLYYRLQVFDIDILPLTERCWQRSADRWVDRPAA